MKNKKRRSTQKPGTVREYKDGKLISEKHISEVYDVKPTSIPGLGYYVIGERDNVTPEQEKKWTENFNSILSLLDDSEPKDGPSKELFSIKPLEWSESLNKFYSECGDYVYSIEKVYHSNKWRGYVKISGDEYLLSEKCFTSAKKGMDEAQAHFNERIKQCLIKEL